MAKPPLNYSGEGRERRGEMEVCLNHISCPDESFVLVRDVLQKHVLVTEQRGYGFQEVQYDLEAEVIYAELFWHF